MIEEIKTRPVWLAWRKEVRNGKQTKVPYQINGIKASTTNPSTWVPYAAVRTYKKKDGIGIVFESTCRIVGIDFDNCLTPDSIPFWLVDFLSQASSYCEFSPSKTGCHVLFQLTEPLDLIAHKHYFDDEKSHVEIYSSGRYFTFTEDEMPQSKSLRLISASDFISLVSLLGYPWQEGARPKPQSASLSATLQITDDKLLEKMFSAKNGSKIKQLFNGDASPYNNDESSADFALCCHLAFWTRKNAPQMERLWLLSPLGQRLKTQSRADYRQRTIENAIRVTPEIYNKFDRFSEEGWTFTVDKKGIPVLTFLNIVYVLRSDPYFKDMFRKNDFSHLVESCLLTYEWMPLTDDVISISREFIAKNYECFNRLSKEMITDAILHTALGSRVNPPRDYFSSLVWDKIPRLNSWLHEVYGVPDDELHQAIGSNWIKGLVKRVLIPGCQFDEVLALEGPQGWRKSSSVRSLGEPWHVETSHSIENKDFYLTIAQNMIVEFSEGEVFDRASVNKVKAEVTKIEDQIRPPYERGIIKFKRSCVFAVTTNKLELKDDTGNRRWLPVTLEKIADVEWLRKNKEQLFAEAFYRVIILNETTYKYPKELLEELQSNRTEYSDFDEKAIRWYAGLPEERRDDGISLHDAIFAVFGSEIRITRLEEVRMGSILRRALCLDNKNKKVNGAVLKRWFSTDKTESRVKKVIPAYGASII